MFTALRAGMTMLLPSSLAAAPLLRPQGSALQPATFEKVDATFRFAPPVPLLFRKSHVPLPEGHFPVGVRIVQGQVLSPLALRQ